MSISKPSKKILFVCLGNICRSAAAEAICKKILKEKKRRYNYEIDSAGTLAYHQGEPADPRMIKHAGERGYKVDSVARKITEDDLEFFDVILVMDYNNRLDTLDLAKNTEQVNKVVLMTQFANADNEVDQIPDPYYGGEEGFDHVIDLLEECIRNMINYFESQY